MTKTTLIRLMGCAALLWQALPGGLTAQDQTGPQPVRGPVMGFVADRILGVRPILGVPGAATVGPPVLPNSGFESITFSALRDYALVLPARGRDVVLLRNLGSSIDAVDLQAPPGAGRMAVSPSGDAAALYYPVTSSVAVLIGLPQSPAVSWNVEAPNLAGGLAALAVSDNGGAVLVATTGEPSSVWLLTPDGGSRFLCYVTATASLAFLAGSHDVLIADGALSTVMLVRDPGGQARITQIGGQSEGVSRPVAVAAAPGNRGAIVANAEPAGVVSLSLEGERPQAVLCNCTVTGLEPLADGATFRLSDPGDGPIWLLDAAGPAPRILFVPNPASAHPRLLRSPLPVRPGGAR
jgi:hypothetical protein